MPLEHSVSRVVACAAMGAIAVPRIVTSRTTLAAIRRPVHDTLISLGHAPPLPEYTLSIERLLAYPLVGHNERTNDWACFFHEPQTTAISMLHEGQEGLMALIAWCDDR